MAHSLRLLLLLCSIVALTGCTGREDGLYERMNSAVKPGDGLQQVQLAHIGHIDTAEGRYEVAVQRLVLTGMLAPRGQTHLVWFARDGTLAKRYWYPCFQNEPLWCEGGRVYLAGYAYVPGILLDLKIASDFAADEVATGNIIDFSRGAAHAVIKREPRYGSSGGIQNLAQGKGQTDYLITDASDVANADWLDLYHRRRRGSPADLHLQAIAPTR